MKGSRSMKPTIKLAEASAPGGAKLSLHEHDGAFTVRLNGQALMDSRVAASELMIGELATERFPRFGKSRVLIGGLGLGFTLRSALEGVGPHGIVELAELIPAMVDWNRTHLARLNGALVDDRRVVLHACDVWQVLGRTDGVRFDAVILDTDNGPSAMVQPQNARLYDERGIARVFGALKVGGRAVIWSASHDRAYEKRLTQAGFTVRVVPAKLHAAAKRPAYILYVADKVPPPAP